MFKKRLIASLIALLILAWSAFVFDQWIERDRQFELQGQRADSLAIALELRIERSVRVVDQMLDIARTEIHDNITDNRAITHILERNLPNLDDVYALAFLDSAGTTVALSTPDIPPGKNHADRDFYRFHRNSSEDQLYVEKPFNLPTSGFPAFTVSRALRSQDGTFLGIILAVIKTDVLARELEAIRIGERGSVGLHNVDSYTVVARQPGYIDTAAKTIAHDDLRAAIEKAPSGRFVGAISTDNVHRLVAYRKLPNLPLAVTAGISYDDINRELAYGFVGHFVVIVILTLISVLGTHFLLTGHRREMELRRSLHEKGSLINAFIEAVPAGVATLDKDMRYHLVNPALAKINCLPISDYAGRTVNELQPRLAARLASYHQGVFSGESYSEVEFQGPITDSSESRNDGYWRGYFFPILGEDDDVVAMGCFVVDVTEQRRNATALKESERALEKSQREIRALAVHQTEVVENDRKYVAQEIHDELGQLLTALKYGISVLDHAQEKGGRHSQEIERLLGLVEQTIVVVRRISSHLRPGILDLGLLPAIEWLASDFSQHTKIPCRTSFGGETPALNETITINAFRAVQESLTNVAKHAGASSVSIALQQLENDLVILISDDGNGFDSSRADSARNFGLFGMRERVISVGGALAVESKAGAGTTVKITIPCRD